MSLNCREKIEAEKALIALSYDEGFCCGKSDDELLVSLLRKFRNTLYRLNKKSFDVPEPRIFPICRDISWPHIHRYFDGSMYCIDWIHVDIKTWHINQVVLSNEEEIASIILSKTGSDPCKIVEAIQNIQQITIWVNDVLQNHPVYTR